MTTREAGARGLSATPFRQFLLKIHSLCNLSCDYCYVYFAADQSWRRRPAVMDLETVRQAAVRIVEHAREHRLSTVRIILHGGEPLLVGKAHLGRMLTVVAEHLAGTVEALVSMQSNGILLDEEWLALLGAHGVGVSVSLDGSRAAHDRHRRHANGRPSHARVAEALRLLNSPRHRERYVGILCTLDLANDPVETYESLLEFSPPRVDFLLPHGTWLHPPPGLEHREVPPERPPTAVPPNEPTPYALWLTAAFDRWFDAPQKETGVRMFEEIVSGVLGDVVNAEGLGTEPVDLVVVETDGTMEHSDSLKVVAEGAPETGLDVFRHSFSDALGTEVLRRRQAGLDGLSRTCRDCGLVQVCGGGLFTHRSHPSTGFVTPSVYCYDLWALIDHVRSRVHTAMARAAGKPVRRVRGS
ncbi:MULTISPECIES: FxsB family cyclophane-forming radical SAM/SPASM peptide maturase [Streptomyces]|nr:MULTISPECIES: FxsB family cyclophane-forming radical SAM/SPASM peptide maturase [Streptomyces]MDX2538408.1 FxsB family radical SAM/SPASM domain protein [Streptomyces scabiei]MDX2579073.1 FxsB family radical SAM/SPASM domain protein [Streptomyces scabiei]MDX2627911.1 FxsB family radical SAM/SPASM domain protein [Streptomyces scabiei]MDX2651477.1 FxsB family radical SAM/SPASM domain protein [Streptomyces scabiei]MDX2687501.1 FxsB family radical SAM/SPASM domain protein [Streptomyces scabiei]